MGNDNLNVGSDLAVFFAAEDTLLTPKIPVATDAMQALSATIGRPVQRVFARDRRGSRSNYERVTLRQPVCPWTISTLLRPSGSAGTAPDVGIILKHLMGTETGNGSITYSFLDDPTALSASIYVARSETQEGVYGAVVNSLKCSWGEGLVKMDFAGEGTQYINAGRALCTGITTSSTWLYVDDGGQFSQYGIVQLGSDDNDGAGFRIESKTGTRLVLSAATSVASSAVVKAFLPDPTYAGDPLADTAGSLSLDNGSTTIAHLPSTFDLKNGVTLLTQEAFQSTASDVLAAGLREVTPNFNFLVKRQNNDLVNDMRADTEYDGIITIGSDSGDRMKINMNKLELDVGDQDSPEDGVEKFSVTGPALASATAGADECTIVFD
jgi:hypothetical protein